MQGKPRQSPKPSATSAVPKRFRQKSPIVWQLSMRRRHTGRKGTRNKSLFASFSSEKEYS
jgi:hypothetical protein